MRVDSDKTVSVESGNTLRRNADAPEPVLDSQQQYSLVCKSPETFNTITIK